MSDVIGGGPKKVLYTLETVRRIGLKHSAKALTAKNTCKACALGMGGQRGGMTNESGEYPAVCNKSIQAQSSDIQPPIPDPVFAHTLDDLRELSAHELEHLGRLAKPLYKARDSDRYQVVDWDWALDTAAARFAATSPERSFFYSSGRSSNEAGFVLQLLARLYGTNNVNNCAFYCHQATGIGMQNTVGTGTATIELADLDQCDLVFVIGANPASNHPRFIHKLKACRDRGGEVIVINPAREPGLVRFAVPKSARSMLSGGSWIASAYLQPHIGSDLALLKGIAKSVLAEQAEDHDFMAQHTSGHQAFIEDIAHTDWTEIEQATGLSQAAITDVGRRYAQAKRVIFAWGMGVTHHVNGTANVESIANLALLRGMIGKPHAGLLPLRGHSNVQGIGTIGVKPVLAKDVFENLQSAFDIKLPKAPGYDTLAGLTAAADGRIDAALLLGGNLFGASPRQAWARQAMENIGFKLYLTTTLNQGHLHGVDDSEAIILPVTARDEEWQPTTQESMFNYLRLSDGGIDRLDNVRPEVVILSDLAARLLPDCPVDFAQFKQHRSLRQVIARVVPGMEALAEIDQTKQEFHIRNRLLHTPAFNTADGKAHFKVHPLPRANKPADYLFRLATVRSEGQYNTIIYEEKDSYRQTRERWSVLVNPEDLAALGVQPGERVTLESPHGRMPAVTAYPFDVKSGNLLAYFPEANVLSGQEHDPRSKTPSFKSIPVAIRQDLDLPG